MSAQGWPSRKRPAEQRRRGCRRPRRGAASRRTVQPVPRLRSDAPDGRDARDDGRRRRGSSRPSRSEGDGIQPLAAHSPDGGGAVFTGMRFPVRLVVRHTEKDRQGTRYSAAGCPNACRLSADSPWHRPGRSDNQRPESCCWMPAGEGQEGQRYRRALDVCHGLLAPQRVSCPILRGAGLCRWLRRVRGWGAGSRSAVCRG